MIQRLAEKFDELSQLKAGWHDGQGTALDADKLKIVAQTLTSFYPEHLPLPTIVPTPDGNLLLEWDVEGDPSMDINLGRLTASFHAFGPHGEDVEAEFSLRGVKGDGAESLFAITRGILHP